MIEKAPYVSSPILYSYNIDVNKRLYAQQSGTSPAWRPLSESTIRVRFAIRLRRELRALWESTKRPKVLHQPRAHAPSLSAIHRETLRSPCKSHDAKQEQHDWDCRDHDRDQEKDSDCERDHAHENDRKRERDLERDHERDHEHDEDDEDRTPQIRQCDSASSLRATTGTGARTGPECATGWGRHTGDKPLPAV